MAQTGQHENRKGSKFPIFQTKNKIDQQTDSYSGLD